MRRPYTGNKDGVANGPNKQTVALVNQLERYFPALWNNGIWAVRDMRSKKQLSVHATGRAADVSYRYMKTKGVPRGGRRQAVKAMNFIVQNADELGLEMCIDYQYGEHGRTWRCDRGVWLVYQKPTVQFGGTGDWFHIEVDGKRSPAEIRKVFQKLDSPA